MGQIILIPKYYLSMGQIPNAVPLTPLNTFKHPKISNITLALMIYLY
jgi:hypothetical protein